MRPRSLVTCGATAGGQPNDDIAAIVSKHLKIYSSTLGSREEFRRLMSFMAVKQIKPIVDSVFPLNTASADMFTSNNRRICEAGVENRPTVYVSYARQT